MKIKFKKFFCFAAALALTVGVFTGCGKSSDKKKTDAEASSTASATAESVETKLADPDSTPYVAAQVPSEFKASGANISEKDGGGVTVALETRDQEASHEFDSDDLGFVDTYSGALIKIGMTADEIESIIGLPKYVDSPTIRYYNGIVVNYDDDLTAKQIVVAAGNMEEEDDPARFVTPRGLGLGASIDTFTSVYGQEYTVPTEAAEGDTSIRSSATMAVRYYEMSGDTFTYLGESYTAENKPEDDNNLVMQSFLFSTETNNVSVISIRRGTDIN